MNPVSEVRPRYLAVLERVSQAAARSGRAASAVRVLLASKNQNVEAIRAAYAAGARLFGENYVQEALAKQQQLGDLVHLEWHFIGHLQSNKARAMANFALIHSLDSSRLAAAVARHAGRRVPVLIEVNLGGETGKSGVSASRIEELIDASREQVDIRGLMAIPPPTPDASAARRYFAELARIGAQVAARTGLTLSELSMGMSSDFEAAIEEGATIVRIGTAIFGARGK